MGNSVTYSKDTKIGVDGKITDPMAFYQAILENVHDGIMVTDKNDVVIYVNQGMEKIAGVKAPDILGRSIPMGFAPETIRYFIKFYEKAKSDLQPQQFESDVVTPSGRFTIQSGWLTPRLDDNQYNGMVCTIQDITERKQAEKRLVTSERRYSRLVDDSPDIIVSFDKDGRLISCNSKMEQVTGYSRYELLGKHFTEINLLADDNKDEIYRAFRAMVDGKAFVPRSFTIISKGGSPVVLEINARQVKHGDEGSVVQIVMRDITERMTYEEQLKRLNRSLEVAQEMAQVGYWTYNFNTGKGEWSRTMYLIFGRNPEDGIPDYERNWELFHPDDRKVLDTAVKECRKGTPYDLVVRVVNEDRLNRYVRTVGYPRYDDKGNVVEIYGMIHDITELKTAEKAIRRSEQMYKSLYELSPNAIILIDSDSKIMAANKRLYAWLGYRDEDLMGKRALDLPFIDVRSRQVMRKNFESRLRGEHIPEYDIELTSRSGRNFIARLSGTVIHEDELLCMVILSDVTEQFRMEEELRKSEEKYRGVVDNMATGISVLDTELKIQALNPQMKQWFPNINIADKPCCYHSFANPPEAKPCHNCPVVKTLEDGQVHEAVVETLVGDEVKNYRILSAPTKRADGTIESVIEMVEDITTRLKMERELFNAEKMESVGVLAGGIANDFNNILVTILGNISLAKLQLDPDTEIFNLLKNAEDASERARDLTQELLTFSPGGEPIKKTVSLAKLLKDTVTFDLYGTNVVAEFDIAPDLSQANVDLGQIIQVVNNLIINAIQAMPGGGTVYIKASNTDISSRTHLPLNPGQYVEISIRDQGHGISPDIMGKIFDPFFTTKSSGNGLGLSSCYSIVKRHGGHIDVDSAPGQGAAFIIYLPAADRVEDETMPESAGLATGHGRILVVDDDEWVRKLASDILGKMGYEVHTASNGDEAVHIVKDINSRGETIDTAIIDLTIPGHIGGKDIICALKDIDPGLKAIVSSGYANDPVMGNYEAYGFSGRIAKPYRASELSSLISRVMNATRSAGKA